jgi:hypothetical protein
VIFENNLVVLNYSYNGNTCGGIVVTRFGWLVPPLKETLYACEIFFSRNLAHGQIQSGDSRMNICVEFYKIVCKAVNKCLSLLF